MQLLIVSLLYEYRLKESLVLENEDLKAVNTENNPNNVIPHRKDNAVVDTGVIKVNLPKHSWNVIRLSKQC